MVELAATLFVIIVCFNTVVDVIALAEAGNVITAIVTGFSFIIGLIILVVYVSAYYAVH